MKPSSLVVKKFGGATVANPDLIKSVAARIKDDLMRNLASNNNQPSEKKIVVVVSAMGKTTNNLIELANQVSNKPNRREMDMLLSVGERISMALLSMALDDLGIKSKSFTGSQAGIFTDDSHENAKVIDVKSYRISEELTKYPVIILAGFQGVNPINKEITTLGRGGSDTTAVAISASLKADICEILKDVPSIFSADPKIVNNPKILQNLTYEELMEMTFWGAKVLHYRCVELAAIKKVPLYVGAAAITESRQNKISVDNSNPKISTLGTHINSYSNKEKFMNQIEKINSNSTFESSQILSINSHKTILIAHVKNSSLVKALNIIKSELSKNEIIFPQILYSSMLDQGLFEFVFTAPEEVIQQIKKISFVNINFKEKDLSCLSLTCTGLFDFEIQNKVLETLNQYQIEVSKTFLSSMTFSLIIPSNKLNLATEKLHDLITTNS